MAGASARMLKILSSLWLTIGLLVSVAVLLSLTRFLEFRIGYALAIPFAALFINLLAAVAVNARIQKNIGLLVFHLSLAAIALLASLGHLMSLKGHVEITEGAAFEPADVVAEAGPLHPWRLDEVKFIQGGYEIKYLPGMRRRDTQSHVMVPQQGRWRSVVVGDDVPLVQGGYRFYTSFNKGFAPVLTFTGADGESRTGSIHMPSYPLNFDNQGNEWHPPNSSAPVVFWLKIDKPVHRETSAWSFAKPENPRLVVNDGKVRHELAVGDQVSLAGGVLKFTDLRTWMGYTIFYDPSVFWMLAAVVVGVSGLAWHIFNTLRKTAWDRGTQVKAEGHAD